MKTPGEIAYDAYCVAVGGHSAVTGALLPSYAQTNDVVKKGWEAAAARLCAQGTEGAVCADIAARQRHGMQKYGTTVQENPLPLERWLQHAYEEALDLAVYLRRSMEELEKEKSNER